jgi:hypothetical protein
MENISNSNGYGDGALHVPVTSPVNTSRTCETIGTELTRQDSRSVPMTTIAETRSMLKTKALAEPGDTPARRAYHNLLEMTESYSRASDLDQKRGLKANISRELKRLNDLSQPR